ncbi:MAG: hypothetical protein ABI321_09810 [Polyangia bacterium]
MPAEAIHLSALSDSAVPAADDELRALQRLGAVVLDLAYFDRFAAGVARYVLRRPLATSPLGDALHARDPSRVARSLVEQGRVLRESPSTRRDGERVLAVALGLLSHLAVDSRLHPLVNQLAKVRAQRLDDRAARQHSEVEKFHSILFHEVRLGFDFMGDRRIAEYIAVEGQRVHDGGAIARALASALEIVHGSAPPASDIARWTRGYRQYTSLLASFIGKRIMPQATKEAVRAEVYDDARFLEHYADAVQRSVAYTRAGLALADDGDVAAFDLVVLPGSIDDPPQATDRERGLEC